MGASEFLTDHEGGDVNEAFDQAYRQAKWEHGHGGYTGSLAEKDSFIIVDQKPRSYDQAIAYANELIRAGDPRINDKWGPAGALPYWDATASETATKTVNITITDKEIPNPADTWGGAISHINKKIQEQYGDKHSTIDVRIIEGPRNVKAAVQSASTKGKTKKCYVVAGREFDTMAQARAHMDKALRIAAQEGRAISMQVQCVQVREDGSPLATGAVKIKRAEYVVELSTTEVSNDFDRAPDGWVFFGWASR